MASSIRAPWPRDYYMVAILDRPANLNYSSRAAGAAYCVADVSTEAFRRFHVALFARQPSETAATFPTDTQLAETARQAGADDADCIISERYSPMVQSLAQATGIKSTPTVRINGQDHEFSTPAALAEKAKEIAGRELCLSSKEAGVISSRVAELEDGVADWSYL